MLSTLAKGLTCDIYIGTHLSQKAHDRYMTQNACNEHRSRTRGEEARRERDFITTDEGSASFAVGYVNISPPVD
jgi:hypothetical protein